MRYQLLKETESIPTMIMQSQQKQKPVYVLGHSDEELQRLIRQARFFGDLTEQVFLNAGVQSGMRVLDVGCGVGDVSFLLARMVGPSGSVLGIDKSPEAIIAACDRAQAAGLKNVTFLEGDIEDISLEYSIDAAVGRLILLYLADPAQMLRRIAEKVKTGGIIAFQDMDMSNIRSLPRIALFQQCAEWIVETFRRGGVETQMGLKLFQTFIAAGLPAPQMILGARVEGGPNSAGYEYFTDIMRSLLPMMERLDVVSAEEVQIATLAERLRDKVTAGGGVIVLPSLVGAWTTKRD